MANDSNTTVSHLRNLMQEFVDERDWQKFHNAKNLAGSIAIESAELMELFQWLSVEEAQHRSLTSEELRQDISDEMADVCLYLLSMANTLNIDLSKAVVNKLAKNRIKYPAAP